MRLIRSLVGVLLAVCALAAVMASAAQAVEGPFWKVNGARLAAGGKAPIEAKTSKEYILTAGTIEIKSKKSKLKASELLGSTGKDMGVSAQTVEFEENTVVGNGTGCTIGTIKTELLEGGLAYEKENATTKVGEGKVYVDFANKKVHDEGKTGGVLAPLTFNAGTGCTIPTATVEGEVSAEAQSENKPVEVGVNEKEAEIGQVVFPGTTVTANVLELSRATPSCSAAIVEGKCPMANSLKAFGKASKLVGASEVKLASKEKWGVFTK
jgi:hypothetical protein